jgi:hypothetical protein
VTTYETCATQLPCLAKGRRFPSFPHFPHLPTIPAGPIIGLITLVLRSAQLRVSPSPPCLPMALLSYSHSRCTSRMFQLSWLVYLLSLSSEVPFPPLIGYIFRFLSLMFPCLSPLSHRPLRTCINSSPVVDRQQERTPLHQFPSSSHQFLSCFSLVLSRPNRISEALLFFASYSVGLPYSPSSCRLSHCFPLVPVTSQKQAVKSPRPSRLQPFLISNAADSSFPSPQFLFAPDRKLLPLL